MFDNDGKVTIRNCPPSFRLVCKKLWDELARTDHEGVRYCAECKENVHLCETDAEMLEHARNGHCIAKYMPEPGIPWGMFLGRPKHPSDPQTIAAETEYQREQNKSRSLKYMHEAKADCPVCGFPQSPPIQVEEGRCLICNPYVLLGSDIIKPVQPSESEA